MPTGTPQMDLSMNNCSFDGPVKDVLSHNVTKINYYNYSDLHQFLTPLDPESRHIVIRDGHTKGTGVWLLRSSEFREWHAGTGARVLCCTGEPGIGKTYLACRVIEKLREDHGSVVCHVYCDYVDKERQTALNILGAILLRIVMHMDSESDVTTQLQTRSQLDISLEIEEIPAFLYQSLTSGGFKSVWLCLDALDELDPSELDRLLHSFSQLCNIPDVYIFFTGRRNAGVESSIDRLLGDITTVEYFPISTIETCPDMQLFLLQKLKDDRYSELLDSDLRETIFERFAGVDSTFLLASLNVKVLLKKKTRSERREALNANALHLNIAYEQMIERIKEQDAVYGMRILQWVLFSMRPLSLQELRYALAIRPGVKDLNPAEDLPPRSIIDITLGLITIEKSTDSSGEKAVVRLVLFTLKEHLLSNSSVHFPTGHSLLAEATLAYLSHKSIRNEKHRYDRGGDLHQFYSYAVMNWGHHVREGEDERLVFNVCRFLRGNNFPRIPAVNRITGHQSPTLTEAYCSPIRIATYFGLPGVLSRFLTCRFDKRFDLDGSGQDVLLSYAARECDLETVSMPLGKTADPGPDAESCLWSFSFAAEVGRLEVVKLLLEQAAIIAKLPEIGATAVTYATTNGHLAVVKLLLDKGQIGINTFDYYGQTPLTTAACFGHVGITEWLLEQRDIDVNLANRDGWDALQIAACKGHTEVVKLFLAKGNIGMNTTHSARTPLICAVWLGNGFEHNVEVVRLLLGKGINANLADPDNGRTALSYAAGAGAFGIVRLLLEQKGIVSGVADHNGRTALSYAAGVAAVEVVQLLLQQKTLDIGVPDRSGRTALSYAAECGALAVVQLLVERNIDVGFTDIHGRTALSYAAESGKVEVVQLLLEQEGIGAGIRDNNGRTALSYAASYKPWPVAYDIIKSFLQRKTIDINSVDNRGRTALSYAAESCNIKAIELLLEQREIDAGVVDNDGHTALLYAVLRGDEATIQLLLKREDVNLALVDNNGRSVLSYALESEDARVARLLLARRGTDTNHTDNNSRSLLSYASAWAEPDIINLLLKREGVRVNSTDMSGRTALSYAAEKGNIGAVELLLEQKEINVGICDKDGLTALSYAEGREEQFVVKLLRRWEKDKVSGEGGSRIISSISGTHDICAVKKILGERDSAKLGY